MYHRENTSFVRTKMSRKIFFYLRHNVSSKKYFNFFVNYLRTYTLPEIRRETTFAQYKRVRLKLKMYL